MTEANRSSRKRLWIVLLIILIVLILLVGGWWFQSNRLEQARLANMPPFVFLTSPQQGDRFQAGQMVFVDASSRGLKPVMLLELLVDGQLVESDESPNAGGSVVRYGHFSFSVDEGVHIIHVRATDVDGLVGLSVPIGIEALTASDEGRTAAIRYGPEMNIEGLAEMAGMSPEELLTWNPDLAEGGRPGGGLAIVPGVADDEPEGPDAEQPAAPSGSPSHAGSPPTIVGDLFPHNNASNLPWALVVPASPPSAPVDITANEQNCQVTVSWSVLTQDASLFRLWMDAQDGTRLLVGTFRPSNPPAERYTTTFDPPRGGVLALYVEAVNAIGAQSSSTAIVNVGRGCAAEEQDRLRFETVGVEVDPSVHRVYFYLSLDGTPEFRLPRDDSQFFTAVGGQGLISGVSNSDSLLSLPLPQSGVLTLSGECWGWSGGELRRLSVFQQQIAQSAWAGSPVVVGDSTCQVTLKLQGAPGFLGVTTFAGNASGQPAPYDLTHERIQGLTASMQWSTFASLIRDLYWKWNGDPQEITGFTIYLDGNPILKVQGANEREARILLPMECGSLHSWYVVANGSQGDSPPSASVDFLNTPCTNYAKVDFHRLLLSWTCDRWCIQTYHYCDRLEAYYRFSVNGLTRSYFSSNFPRYMWCGYYRDSEIFPSGEDVFIVPLGTSYILSSGPFEVMVESEFWDQDDWSKDDSFAHHERAHGYSSWMGAINNLLQNCGDTFNEGREFVGCPPDWDDIVYYSYDGTHNDDARSKLWWYLSLYPNSAQENP